ncbi:glycosyltransferase [Spirochaeta cellobiosiphila]|uniref:glycosyltransferase n=1 Tax=Spirochaeta cellobiosiphila TaxID=504483 RepID=UPI00146DC4A3|nr:glycosyltransferase [Spirochaeta cellobiosiphila]
MNKLLINKILGAFKNSYNIENIIRYNLLQKYLEDSAMRSSYFGVEKLVNTPSIIISLTTYSKRIEDVHLTIESIFNQTKRPNKIILWLDENEFNSLNVPRVLLKQCERGLEIKYCKNTYSYKKIIPTLLEHENDIIITIDDDVLYPINFIEKLYYGYLNNNKAVFFYRGKVIQRNNYRYTAYKKWPYVNSSNSNPYLNFPTGVGGILYPPGCFDERIFDEKLFLKLAPFADDIWLKAMTLLKGFPSFPITFNDDFNKKFLIIPNSQDISLYLSNVNANRNDEQFKNVFSYFKLDEVIKSNM